ncbi:MAG: molybdopterin-guanine dinucleotide biosynthesis protein B [Hyphomicrobiaceae bacterium]|nr:MAG: molybdopterin-guanine dinucleotide biosynthesis protein B [Hyphomicrobiaceae bacterium]
MKQGLGITPVIGIAGWKNSGKTTLVAGLISEFSARGLKVATVKHAHHNFQIDDAETDSARHRRSGAGEVAIVSRNRWAIVRELKGAPEPDLAEVISWLDPCDLVIVEGYKRAPIPKIEVRRDMSASQEKLADKDPTVIAIAADHSAEGRGIPVFALDDVAGIADFIAAKLGVAAVRTAAGAASS